MFMTIPLDRLYDYIRNLSVRLYGNNVLIYRFWPHGSKNIQDLNPLHITDDWFSVMTTPSVWCHDQEPLDYDYYANTKYEWDNTSWTIMRETMSYPYLTSNINYLNNIFDKSLLLHSEKRSKNLKQYLQTTDTQPNSQLLSVYYWSHALIARDWFRFAEHETFCKKNPKLFLVYNRAWSGTREYRLKFTDLLIENNIINQCLTFCNPKEHDVHYHDHKFKNSVWKPKHRLEKYIGPTMADSSSSADFDTKNYDATLIEVVLETLFDDDRLHLTEKSLRPIACCQPFILVATNGSLAYLRSYGFKTFDAAWDESYDNIKDPVERMQAIVKIMLDISNWNDTQRSEKINCMYEIAKYNQKHFFSKSFFDLITEELQTNLNIAFEQIKIDPGFKKFIRHWGNLFKYQQVHDFLDSNMDLMQPTRQQYDKVLDFIKHHPKTIADLNKI
jgi:hypothetical protein